MKLPQVIAHRGGRKWAPENTLAAFRRSLEFGADGIELDIQRCATGELVVFHDEELSRTTNGAGLIKDFALADLRKLSAGAWFGDQFGSERIPLLAEVLNLIAGKLVINIELKNSPVEYPNMIADLLVAIERYPQDSLIISSFDHKLMRCLHEQAPHLTIALLGAAIFVDLAQVATAIGASYFHPAYDCFRSDIAEEARRAGLEVNVWTCNSAAQWRSCLSLSVAGIVTDDPQGLRAYLNAIGTPAPGVL